MRINAYEQFAGRDVNSVLDEELGGFAHDAQLSILDVGCGNGKQSLYCSKLFPNATITAMDVSVEAIAQLKRKNTSINAYVCDLNDLEAFKTKASK